MNELMCNISNTYNTFIPKLVKPFINKKIK
jgi:hypothetical protein